MISFQLVPEINSKLITQYYLTSKTHHLIVFYTPVTNIQSQNHIRCNTLYQVLTKLDNVIEEMENNLYGERS